MQDIMVHLTSPTSKTIHTTLTDSIESIIESEGFAWFDALKGPVELSETGFKQVELLLAPDPG